jgi:hypothetical protein
MLRARAGEFGSYQEALLQLRQLIAASIPSLNASRPTMVGLLEGFMVC